MLLYLLLRLAQFFGVGFFLIFVAVTVIHFKKMKRYAPYREQGVYFPPGYDKFPLGNISQIDASQQEFERAKHEGLDVIRHSLIHMLDQLTESKTPYSFDYAKHPTIMLNSGISLMLIADPLIIQ